MLVLNTIRKTLNINSLTFLFVALGFTLIQGQVYAQEIPEAKWTYTLDKTEAHAGDVVTLTIKTDIPDGLHIYSNDFSEDCPPQKAELTFQNKSAAYEVLGKMVPKGSEKEMDDIFRCEVSIFHHHAEFKQKIKVHKTTDFKIDLFYQMCTEDQCVNFHYVESTVKVNVTDARSKPEAQVEQTVNSDTPSESGVSSDETTEKDTGEVEASEVSATDQSSIDADSDSGSKVSKESDDVEGRSIWGLFILGVLGGIPALLTPCVYPMIPMTVAFFTKQEDRKKGMRMATIYGISIILIYVVFGVLISVIFGDAFAYTLSTHWLPNIVFFLVFIIFAISFFGMFELTLPSSFVNNMNKQSDRGGYIGVFFVAFTLVLVSFSCTAPIVGSVAILAAKGAIVKSVAAMLGFAVTFALPFSLFALFPQWLNKMPQSGGWLNSVKVILGFLEVALALKFLSQADLAYHWGILDRDVFLALWIIIALSAGFYLLGKIKFPHDTDLPHISVPRFFIAMLFLSFGAYMVPGLWGAPLKPLAGILPPMHTQDFKGQVFVTGENVQHEQKTVKFGDFLHVPHGFTAYFDYNEALEASKRERKPIFVDFTGHTCANCRRMEEKIWIEPEIKSRLNNDFIMLSLYCDERHELPESEWFNDENGNPLKSIGDQNQFRQSKQFGSNGQPSYYVMDWDENVYAKSLGYSPDVQGYADFLDNGKKQFEEWLAKR